MSNAILTSPPTATARLVVDTDVASFVFKWHPEFAPRYVDVLRWCELVISFMTMAEMRQGTLDANWGPRKRAVLEAVPDFWRKEESGIMTAYSKPRLTHPNQRPPRLHQVVTHVSRTAMY